MSIATQYNPNHELNARLLAAGGSKTVYALVTPETEAVKDGLFNHVRRPAYLEMFRDAWTNKQDSLHREFFDLWHEWSAPVVDLDRQDFPFFYPTAGASEALHHLIYSYAAKSTHPVIHIFEGEYEGYKALAEDAHVKVVVHSREDWREVPRRTGAGDLFFISHPSAIDGSVWRDFNAFLSAMNADDPGYPRVVVDVTYVGAIPETALRGERFNLRSPCIRNVVFSLSKPFGVYYDRIGGVWARKEDAGLYGKIWFKNLTSIAIGSELMRRHGVFYMPDTYGLGQEAAAALVGSKLDIRLEPADVFILATGQHAEDPALAQYLRRPEHKGPLRVCLTKAMAESIGTSGAVL